MKKEKVFLILALIVAIGTIGYFVWAWTPPSVAPPGGNVPAPVNTGSDPQIKEGSFESQGQITAGTMLKVGSVELTSGGMLTVPNIPQPDVAPGGMGRIYFDTTENKFKISENAGTYTDLLCPGGGCGPCTTFQFNPSSVPAAPTKGQLFFNNLNNKIYFYDGSKWNYITGVAESICTGGAGTDDPNCGIIDCSGWYVKTGVRGVNTTEYCYNTKDITTNRCEGVEDCKDPNSSDCRLQPENTLQYSCGTCKYIENGDCEGTRKGSCTNYPDYTPCSGGRCCGGKCVASPVPYWRMTGSYRGMGNPTGEYRPCTLARQGETGTCSIDVCSAQDYPGSTNMYTSRDNNPGPGVYWFECGCQ